MSQTKTESIPTLKLLKVSTSENIITVTMTNSDNRFTTAFMDEWFLVMDFLDNQKRFTILITESADPKIWSNGLDIEEITEKKFAYVNRLALLCFRLMVSHVYSIANIHGHAFAGGCIFALAHD
mmetsp:Transcript_37586/g.81848  ORF Transcript_37586/g.81848 Transcript_37586/m.81848 type:complete len:124 (-) Transcript_37586:494-865(-)